MKSIVLCERTLVHDSEDFSATLKDRKINEGSKKKAEEKKKNGTSESNWSETVIKNTRVDGKINCRGNSDTSETFKEDVNEDKSGKKSNSLNELGNGIRGNHTSSETKNSVAIDKTNLCGEKNEKDDIVPAEEFSPVENNTVEDGAQNSSEQKDLNQKRDFNNIKVESGDEILESDKSGFKKEESGKREETSDNVSVKESSADPIENKVENEHTIVNIDLDVDENKENEKEGKRNEIDEFPGNESLNKESSGCEIQVGDVQSITGSDSDCMWAENDFKSSPQTHKETTSEKFSDRSQDVLCLTEGITEVEKENNDSESYENATFEGDENAEESMHVEEENEVEGIEEHERDEEEEDEDGVIAEEVVEVEVEVDEDEGELEEEEEEEGVIERGQMVNEEKKNDVREKAKSSRGETTTNGDVDNNTCQQNKDNVFCRKRQLSDNSAVDTSAKRKRRSMDNEEEVCMQPEKENIEDSSRCEDIPSLDTDVSSEGQTSSKAGTITTKRTSTSDNKNGKKRKFSVENEELTTETKISVLERFRGTLKTLTRSDLEELIVQKLCEVITERSNVGELRRKAQALEQDQERWKAKFQSLTKQMREMEMVMKKYMTEVQKQVKEGDTHVVTPLKVTRSVGLQVSFYSSANKGPKPGVSQPSTPPSSAQNVNSRSVKITPPKLPSQISPANQTVRSKPSSYQKSSPAQQKSSIHLQRRSIVPKPDYLSTQPNRAMQQNLLNTGRGASNQISRTNYKSISGVTTTTTTSSASSAQQQNGSKVIDLTDDDDRQTGNVVKTSGSIRVVNHLPPVSVFQASGAQGNRFAYFLPTTNAATAPSGGQSRQVLIATPTMPQPSRQIMCSMPPLLFKGGNVVQSGPQSHVVNQSNKVILPKTLRHPAPLPQQPINQNSRPNLKLLPPRPALKISKVQTGIVLSWNMSLSPDHAPIASYQLYAYQESNCPPSTSLWKKVGDVKALPLPMACTLTQFMSGHKYHFAVRAVDLHSRIGPFSFPGTIVLVK